MPTLRPELSRRNTLYHGIRTSPPIPLARYIASLRSSHLPLGEGQGEEEAETAIPLSLCRGKPTPAGSWPMLAMAVCDLGSSDGCCSDRSDTTEHHPRTGRTGRLSHHQR